MKHTENLKKNILGKDGEFEVTQYFTSDVAEEYRRYLYKECEVEYRRGIIIGIEDNEAMQDVYFIVYVPELREVRFALTLDAAFYDTIKE